MSSFWRNDDKIKVSQTQVSVPSTNGRSYTGTAGQSGRRIDFEIPPTVKFMDGKNSYLQFDIKIGIPATLTPTRLHLDPFIGGQAVVRNLRIYSGSRSVLLEEISDYNAKVQMEYSYNQDDSMRAMRAMKEGSLVTNVESRGTLGTSVSNNIDIQSNPYYKPVGTVPAGRDWGNADDFLTAKVSLPIHCGLFAESSKIFPVMMTDGLFVEVDIEDPARFVKQLDSVNRHRRMKQNPIFHGVDVGGNALTVVNATNRTEIFLGLQNNMMRVENCPFVKGERIGICSATDPRSECALTLTASGGQGYPKIENIELDGSGKIKITCEQFQNSDSGTGVEATSNNFILFSAAIDTDRRENDDATAVLVAATTAYPITTEISNAEIVVQQVGVDPRYEAGMMKRMRDGGTIEIDIPSVTNYKHSLLSSNRNATINLAVSNTRAKSMIVMPTDARTLSVADLMAGAKDAYEEETTDMDGRLHSIRSGQVGIIDHLTSYQMMVDDKLVARPIVVSKINKGESIAAQPLIELEKALNQAGIVPRSFTDYNRNFLIGRAYALNDGVANLNNKSNQLQLLYNETNAAGADRPPTRDKLLFCFLFHIRRISIKGESVTVSL
tara:strand:+ start:2010 stop:3839 length:1830 start_codon:yes stop_codon:yes gene_type:complete